MLIPKEDVIYIHTLSAKQLLDIRGGTLSTPESTSIMRLISIILNKPIQSLRSKERESYKDEINDLEEGKTSIRASDPTGITPRSDRETLWALEIKTTSLL